VTIVVPAIPITVIRTPGIVVIMLVIIVIVPGAVLWIITRSVMIAAVMVVMMAIMPMTMMPMTMVTAPRKPRRG